VQGVGAGIADRSNIHCIARREHGRCKGGEGYCQKDPTGTALPRENLGGASGGTRVIDRMDRHDVARGKHRRCNGERGVPTEGPIGTLPSSPSAPPSAGGGASASPSSFMKRSLWKSTAPGSTSSLSLSDSDPERESRTPSFEFAPLPWSPDCPAGARPSLLVGSAGLPFNGCERGFPGGADALRSGFASPIPRGGDSAFASTCQETSM
jgi:hypothetical protein